MSREGVQLSRTCPARRRPVVDYYISKLAWEDPGVLLEELEEVAEERDTWASA